VNHVNGRSLGSIRRAAPVCAALLLAHWLVPAVSAEEKPKVRALTAFMRLDRAHDDAQVGETLVMLRKGKAELERAGYEVQTVRIVTQPFTEYTRGLTRDETLAFMRAFDARAGKEDFAANIGPAVLPGSDDLTGLALLTEILSTTQNLNASAAVADARGVRWDAVRATARLIKQVAERTPHSMGTFNFAATALVPEYTPFYPGAWHIGAGKRFAIGLQAANVVDEVFSTTPHDPVAARERLTAAMAAHCSRIEAVALAIEKETGWTYMGIDPTPAPAPDVSIGAAIEKLTGSPFGSSGTLTAAAVITSAIQALPVKRVGYVGLMVPILEDARLAQRWSEGTLTVDAMLAYSAVCGTGLDTIPLPGDVSEEQLARIVGDMATLAVKWRKPLSARLQPVVGRKAGERTEFESPFLVNALLQKLP
jgi:uncharacterized protein (UPF0210 family)